MDSIAKHRRFQRIKNSCWHVEIRILKLRVFTTIVRSSNDVSYRYGNVNLFLFIFWVNIKCRSFIMSREGERVARRIRILVSVLLLFLLGTIRTEELGSVGRFTRTSQTALDNGEVCT